MGRCCLKRRILRAEWRAYEGSVIFHGQKVKYFHDLQIFSSVLKRQGRTWKTVTLIQFRFQLSARILGHILSGFFSHYNNIVLISKFSSISQIWGSYGGKYENHCHLGCDTIYFGKLSTFWRNRLFISLSTLKMEAAVSSERLTNTYHTTRLHIEWGGIGVTLWNRIRKVLVSSFCLDSGYPIRGCPNILG
jgi:hypothetical protein